MILKQLLINLLQFALNIPKNFDICSFINTNFLIIPLYIFQYHLFTSSYINCFSKHYICYDCACRWQIQPSRMTLVITDEHWVGWRCRQKYVLYVVLKGFLLYFPIFFLINRANHSLIKRLWASIPLVLHVFGKIIIKYLHKAVYTGNERTQDRAKEFHMLAHVGQSVSCGRILLCTKLIKIRT